ncbi:hypothetical protein ACGTN6_00975 [Halomonas sp. THAF12]|uniref:Uncharacterized protein n=1 Tax=Halomonas organivorans TaxID=257772 RepID=A0A7W5BW53_9GAMM|nr:hypothetical protein [Halomonas organivorans]MBB3140215.1 hypothetical protein [Halomonas organivorans]
MFGNQLLPAFQGNVAAPESSDKDPVEELENQSGKLYLTLYDEKGTVVFKKNVGDRDGDTFERGEIVNEQGEVLGSLDAEGLAAIQAGSADLKKHVRWGREATVANRQAGFYDTMPSRDARGGSSDDLGTMPSR